jgi:hypothetical protein
MRNFAQMSAVLAGLLGCGGALAFAAVGCGGDDNTNNDAGDSAPDRTSDHSVADHHTSDASDAGSDVDSAPPTDGSVDSPVDSPVDSHVNVDAAALYDFPTAVNTAYCQRLEFCCLGADAGTAATAFVASCVQQESEYGGIVNVNLANIRGGHIKLDPTAAAKCLSDIASISCGTYTSAEETAILDDCSAAMVGQIDLGKGGCTSAWDCAPTAYCAGLAGPLDPIYADDGGLVSDGGTGTCTSLHPVTTSCQDVNFYTDCSYLGNGSPGNFCNPNDAGTGGTCVADYPTGSAGAGCLYNQQCATQICDFGVGCEETGTFSDPGPESVICASY